MILTGQQQSLLDEAYTYCLREDMDEEQMLDYMSQFARVPFDTVEDYLAEQLLEDLAGS